MLYVNQSLTRQGAVGFEKIHFVISSIQIDSSITNNDTRVLFIFLRTPSFISSPATDNPK